MKDNDLPTSSDSVTSKPTPIARDTRELYWIAAVSTGLAFGCGVALLQALHWDANGVQFHLTIGTVVAFIIGAIAPTFYWKLVTYSAFARRVSWWLLALAGLAVFLYPVRFVPAEKRFDVATGLIIAVFALSGVGFLLWQVTRFVENDARAEEANSQKQKD